MSTADDVFDDMVDPDQPAASANVFDDSDDERPESTAIPQPSSQPKVSKLAELANKKRKEMEAATEDAVAAAQKTKKARHHREAVIEEPARQPAATDAPDAGADVFGDQDSDEEPPEVPRTAEDDAFIDDEGADPVDDVFGDEDNGDADQQQELEASEEDDEIDRLMNKKKRGKGQQSMQEIQATVENFLARMEVAAEADMKANEDNKPAIHKLRMLPDVQNILSNQNMHSEFLDGGLLGVFKAWIEPMPDGSLPNITVRSAVLKLLQLLPIDIADEGRKEQLKKSGLGKVVMFLFKLPDETAGNRRIARELVEKWSRPIFDQYREQGPEVQRQRDQELAAARQRRQLREAKNAAAQGIEEENQKQPTPGDPDFRWHARIPERATLDYIKQPQSQIAADMNPSGKAAKSTLMRKLMKKKGAVGRAAKVSVEGRGITL